MRQSALFTKVLRASPKDEEALNAKLLIRAGFIDKVMAGVYTMLPLGLRVLKKIEHIIREEVVTIGGQEVLMPTLQPRANWEATGRWDTMSDLFRFTSYHTKTDYALGPTHEEILSPLMKKFLFSYRDLPTYVFQIQNKFRDEPRAKSGLLRGREFMMKDMYSFHTDENDLDTYYKTVRGAYGRIFERAGVGRATYLTFASGGTFSQYSHEFQTVTDAGEDTIFLCESCRVAVNKEIIGEQKACPECDNKDLVKRRAIEVGNIFKLKCTFSSNFELRYKDKDGKEHDVLMGCYGIGLQRLMGTIVEVHHDEAGMLWPASVAPFTVHLLELKGGTARKVYDELSAAGVEVLYDDRDMSSGEKLVEADLIGIPWRVVASEKTGDKVEVRRRDENSARVVGIDEAKQMIRQNA